MKNVDILPATEVPASIRLDVYKEALDLLENDLKKWSMLGGGLCLALPCLLWGLDDYCNRTPGGGCWDWEDTSLQFPEITKAQIRTITNIDFDPCYDDVIAHQHLKRMRRIEVLKQAIETVNKLLK